MSSKYTEKENEVQRGLKQTSSDPQTLFHLLLFAEE